MILHWLIPIVHAEDLSTSTVATFVEQVRSDAMSTLWTPLLVIIGASITLAIVGMAWRKIRGMARRPH